MGLTKHTLVLLHTLQSIYIYILSHINQIEYKKKNNGKSKDDIKDLGDLLVSHGTGYVFES